MTASTRNQNSYNNAITHSSQEQKLSSSTLMNENKKDIELKRKNEEILKLMTKLTETINSSNIRGNKEQIVNAIKQCFINHNINYVYFDTHTKKEFCQLLKKYNIKVGVAIKIWKVFTMQHMQQQKWSIDLQRKDNQIANLTKKLDESGDCINKLVEMLASTTEHNKALNEMIDGLRKQLEDEMAANNSLKSQNDSYRMILSRLSLQQETEESDSGEEGR